MLKNINKIEIATAVVTIFTGLSYFATFVFEISSLLELGVPGEIATQLATVEINKYILILVLTLVASSFIIFYIQIPFFFLLYRKFFAWKLKSIASVFVFIMNIPLFIVSVLISIFFHQYLLLETYIGYFFLTTILSIILVPNISLEKLKETKTEEMNDSSLGKLNKTLSFVSYLLPYKIITISAAISIFFYLGLLFFIAPLYMGQLTKSHICSGDQKIVRIYHDYAILQDINSKNFHVVETKLLNISPCDLKCEEK